MFKHSLLAIAIVTAALPVYSADTAPSSTEMWRVIQQQQHEINKLNAELNKANTKIQGNEDKVTATADAVEQVGSSKQRSKVASWVEKTSIGGYGEHHFNSFDDDDTDNQIDAHRFVLYFSHQFTDTLRFFSEFELEHAVAGEGQNGEVELEQAYIEHDYNNNHRVQIGQFLIPVGILNETHEPETFYGTERNLVETNIIPTTWWETGVGLLGELAPGLSYNLAVHSGLNTTEGGRVRNGRQKSSQAVAENLAITGRLKYTGIKGLELAATLQGQGDITQGNATEDADARLTQLHAIYQYHGFSIRALWANWDINGAGFEANGRDQQNGWYLEPSYKITKNLGAFARISEFNNNAGDSSSIDTEVFDFGISYWLHPQVVLKADISDFDDDSTGNDSFNLGVGWSF